MRWKGTLTVALLVVAGSVLARAQTTPSLQGAWRVAEVVRTGAGATTTTNPQPGLILFTKQHYSIVTVSGTEPRKDFGIAGDPAKLTDAEKMARYEAWRPFTANSGTYRVTGSTLTTRPGVAKSPAVMGREVTREFRIDGDTLTLIRKSDAGQPVSETTTTLKRAE